LATTLSPNTSRRTCSVTLAKIDARLTAGFWWVRRDLAAPFIPTR